MVVKLTNGWNILKSLRRNIYHKLFHIPSGSMRALQPLQIQCLQAHRRKISNPYRVVVGVRYVQLSSGGADTGRLVEPGLAETTVQVCHSAASDKSRRASGRRIYSLDLVIVS